MYLSSTYFCYNSKELPEKDIDRVNYICNLYDSILQFLTKHGAHLCHVQPQFLLDYEEYIVFLEIIYSRFKVRIVYIIHLYNRVPWICK